MNKRIQKNAQHILWSKKYKTGCEIINFNWAHFAICQEKDQKGCTLKTDNLVLFGSETKQGGSWGKGEK